MGFFSNIFLKKYSGKTFANNAIYVCAHIVGMFDEGQIIASPNNPENGVFDDNELLISMHQAANELLIRQAVMESNPYLNKAIIEHRKGDLEETIKNISYALGYLNNWYNYTIPSVHFASKFDELVFQFNELSLIISKISSGKAALMND